MAAARYRTTLLVSARHVTSRKNGSPRRPRSAIDTVARIAGHSDDQQAGDAAQARRCARRHCRHPARAHPHASPE
jgi:hypothetical protein